MASSSISPPGRVGDYDVFISHCGVDCKRDFAVWLKTRLESVGIRCFFDEHSLEVGDDPAAKMLDAMETARFGIVILSPGFFAREWCMKELQTFVRRGKVVPIFYGAFDEVQDARRAAIAGQVWTGFKQYVRTEEEFVAAANANYTGVRLAETGWWSSCIDKVRDDMLRLLGKEKGGMTISEDELLVGQHEHLFKVKQLLGVLQPSESGADIGATQREVGIVGVKGMGGVGKSTLAKKLYDDLEVREWFTGGVCWLEVGAKPTADRVRDLQKYILKRLCDFNDVVADPTQGRRTLQERLRGKKVLICLDDVWENAALELQPIVRVEDLAPGSRILKTSRIREAVGGDVHDLDALDKASAWKLFTWHAFGGEQPPEELASLAKAAHEKCAGLPLALTILGRQLRQLASQPVVERKECLESFIETPDYDDAMERCCEVIKLSYTDLPQDLADAFLLVAGLWPAAWEYRDQERAIQNLAAAVYGDEAIGRRLRLAQASLRKLSNKSLIKLVRHAWPHRGSRIDVHDLVVEAARRITTNDGPRRRSFASASPLGVPGEHVCISSGETPTSLEANPSARLLSLVATSNFVLQAAPPFQHCRMVSIEGFDVQAVANLRSVQCLRLNEFLKAEGGLPETYIEAVTRLTCLRLLEIASCDTLQWLPESLPSQLTEVTGLTELDFSWCIELATLPESVGQLTGLTKLGLNGCKSLVSLPASVGQLTGLTELDLKMCVSLASLPESLGRLTALTELDFNGCESLCALPVSVGQLTGLAELDLRWCRALATLPGSVGQLTGLIKLDLSMCVSLASLPESMGQLTRLTELDLRWCKSLAALPESMGQLIWLTMLDLEGCTSLMALPESVGRLTLLTELDLRWCTSLAVLPDLLGQLGDLTVLRNPERWEMDEEESGEEKREKNSLAV